MQRLSESLIVPALVTNVKGAKGEYMRVPIAQVFVLNVGGFALNAVTGKFVREG